MKDLNVKLIRILKVFQKINPTPLPHSLCIITSLIEI